MKENISGGFYCILRNRSCRKMKGKNITIRKTVKLRICSPDTTLKVHNSEKWVEENCYKNKKNTLTVKLESFSTAGTPRISLFTPPCVWNLVFFQIYPKLWIQKFQRWKKIATNFFTIKNYIWRKLSVWNMSEMRRNPGRKKFLQTKCAVQYLLNWVQLKIPSERITQQWNSK